MDYGEGLVGVHRMAVPLPDMGCHQDQLPSIIPILYMSVDMDKVTM